MSALYITKIEVSLLRPLSASEKNTARSFFEAGYSVRYAVEFFK